MPDDTDKARALGADLIRFLETDRCEAYAKKAVRYLYDLQTDEEKSAGTSLLRNGEGLCKKHAARLAQETPLNARELKEIVRYYSTQIATAVYRGKLPMWNSPEAVPTSLSLGDESDQSEDEDEDHSDNDDATPITVVPACVAYGCHPILLSRPFVDKVATAFSSLATAEEGSVPFCPKILLERVRETYPGVTQAMVDAAMYQISPAIRLVPALVNRYVRVLWLGDNVSLPENMQWLTALVTDVGGLQCAPILTVRFMCDGALGTLSGSDALYAYEMVDPQRKDRKRARKKIEYDSEDA